jgi:hypothetical protein
MGAFGMVILEVAANAQKSLKLAAHSGNRKSKEINRGISGTLLDLNGGVGGIWFCGSASFGTKRV